MYTRMCCLCVVSVPGAVLRSVFSLPGISFGYLASLNQSSAISVSGLTKVVINSVLAMSGAEARTPSHKKARSAVCPICGNRYSGVRQHVAKVHLIKNPLEMQHLLRYIANRFNGKLDCPICGRKQLERLDKHLQTMHWDLTSQQRLQHVHQAKRKANLLQLAKLRQSRPVPNMRTHLDLDLLNEEDFEELDDVPDEESEHEADSDPEEPVGSARSAEREGDVTGRQPSPSELSRIAHGACGRCANYRSIIQMLRRKNGVLRAQIAQLRTNRKAAPTSWAESRPKYSRSPLPKIRQPTFEKVLQSWYAHIAGLGRRQKDNARQKVSQVRKWTAYMCYGDVPTMDMDFMKDTPRLHKWVDHLRRFAVTTQLCHMQNVTTFLKYLLQAKLEQVKASKTSLRRCLFAVRECMKKVRRTLVSHRQQIRTLRSKNLVDAKDIKAFIEMSAEKMPAALADLEAAPTEANLEKLYGYLSGYLMCLTGHSRVVLENMTAEEVLKATKGQNETRLIAVAKRHPSGLFGHAHLVLTKQEHLWLESLLSLKQQLKGGDSQLVFFNSNGGVFHRLHEVFQDRWTAFRLPGRPTFSMLRTSISTYTGRSLNEEERLQVRRQMCHLQSMARAFCEAESDIREAWEARRLTCKAVETQVGRARQRDGDRGEEEEEEEGNEEEDEEEEEEEEAGTEIRLTLSSDEDPEEETPASPSVTSHVPTSAPTSSAPAPFMRKRRVLNPSEQM
ncbi:hypothetical protein GJAV_G00155070 [Gymnothorax javanicus]|nr:hypothetical protein GJAV_G00155070 [Gymnothorax javanicus]